MDDQERYCGQCRQLEREVERLTASLATANTRAEAERMNREQQSESCAKLLAERDADNERLRGLLHGLLEQPDVIPSHAGFPRSPDGYAWQLYWVRRDALQAAREGGGRG
jgi:hypothetical protein